MSAPPAPSGRTRVRRRPQRAAYDREALHAVLDAGFVAHVGHVVDGFPVVTPTLYWREDDRVYWHGSSASRMLKLAEGQQVCLTVTHLDGLVLARSAFHHSANYRSAMLFGVAEAVTGDAARLEKLRAMMEGMFPGRWDALRPVTGQELKATRLLSLRIGEFSVKVRTGPPVDDDADMDWPVWAGVLPFVQGLGATIPDDAAAAAGHAAPDPATIARRLRAPQARKQARK